jgi:hypothetical protein
VDPVGDGARQVDEGKDISSTTTISRLRRRRRRRRRDSILRVGGSPTRISNPPLQNLLLPMDSLPRAVVTGRIRLSVNRVFSNPPLTYPRSHRAAVTGRIRLSVNRVFSNPLSHLSPFTPRSSHGEDQAQCEQGVFKPLSLLLVHTAHSRVSFPH